MLERGTDVKRGEEGRVDVEMGGVGGGGGGEVDVEMGGGGVATFLTILQFNHIYSVCGKAKFSLLLLFLWSSELAMQDFHFLYSTKTLYHSYISHRFW